MKIRTPSLFLPIVLLWWKQADGQRPCCCNRPMATSEYPSPFICSRPIFSADMEDKPSPTCRLRPTYKPWYATDYSEEEDTAPNYDTTLSPGYTSASTTAAYPTQLTTTQYTTQPTTTQYTTQPTTTQYTTQPTTTQYTTQPTTTQYTTQQTTMQSTTQPTTPCQFSCNDLGIGYHFVCNCFVTCYPYYEYSTCGTV